MIVESITAVIPVKANSSRLKNKNILPFAETTLLEHKIDHLKACKSISEILVTSDSEYMLELAQAKGCTVDYRPLCYADETRPFSDFLDYITSKISSKHMLWACCTSPLVTSNLFDEIITSYNNALKEGYDSLITTYDFKHFLLDHNGTMNFEPGPKHVNSQDLPNIDLFTNGAIMAPLDSVKKWRYHFGKNAFRFPVTQSQSIDIDTELDYEVAKCIWNYTQK
jgi:N-acylneuraminate cytidylyltransferase